MREIKFRAWDKKYKEMIEDIAIYPEYNWSIQSDNDALCERERPDKGQIILMQFTGLYDKDDKEIWEGDLLKDHNGNIREILFEEGGFTFKHGDGQRFISIKEYRKVVGNKFENPELCSKK